MRVNGGRPHPMPLSQKGRGRFFGGFSSLVGQLLDGAVEIAGRLFGFGMVVIPKGLYRVAQGCRAAATLGHRHNHPVNPERAAL